MKRFLSFFLVLSLLFSVCVFAAAENSTELPSVGESVNGFTVRELRDFPLLGAQIVLFEHDRTGAELMYIANSDTNRLFDLTFFTRAIDNTGLPHVFEHATLNGSEKYPSTSLFFNLSYQTYNSYMNAFTYPLMTTYPVSSLSEEQLLKYADFYTDSCLHPSIMEKESIFREEAWRYRMADMEDDLTLEGTVYSEMLGAMNLGSSANVNMLRSAFPGSTIGNVSGGDPAYIPDMTWDSLKAYHDLYYHPSNCIAFLYGKFEDYTAFLKLLDDAFAPYEKQEFTFEDSGYTPITAPVEASFSFPVEASSATENRSVVYYTFVCPSLKENPQEEIILNTLTDLLIADASPLMQQLKKVLPYGSFASFIEPESPEDAIIFMAENINPEDAPVFRDTVDSVLASLAETGFAQDLVDGVMASLSLSTKLAVESSSAGLDVFPSIAYSYASSGNPFNYLDYVESLDELDSWNQQGLYSQAISDWLLNSSTTALVTTYPQPGLREELDAAEAERLAGVKASMSEEELQAVIDATNAEKVSDDSTEYIAQLQAVTVASLPEEQRDYTVQDTTGEDGVRRLTVEADVDAIGQTMLLLDAAGIPQEDIQWFSLYTSLLGEMDTSVHTREELATLMTRYLYSGNIRLSLVNTYGTKEYHPYLRAGWIASDEDLEKGYELIYEILYDTQFTDTETLLGLIGQRKASLKSDITSSPFTAQLYRFLGASSPLYAYYDAFNLLPYYSFLEDVEQMMQDSPEAVIGKLQEIQQIFHNRTNAISSYAGSAEGIDFNSAAADSFFARLDAFPVTSVEYVFDAPARCEALIVDSPVQYNCIAGDYPLMGMEKYTADLDAVSAMVTDLYLFPMLREQYGVYTPMHAFADDAGAYFISYRDPNIEETFQVYEELPKFLSELETDQNALDGYILSSYSSYAMPEGELTGALTAISSCLTQSPSDLKLQYMRELKSLTPEILNSYADAYAKLMETGYRFTSGGAAAINANAEMYDVIFNPFGAVDSSQVIFADVPEDHPHYAAVRFVYENQLMRPAEEETFGADQESVLGDLCGALYGMLGGDASASEEAVSFFAENGLIPEGCSVSDVLTGESVENVLSVFCQAVGLPYEADSAASESAITRGELAEILMAFSNGIG